MINDIYCRKEYIDKANIYTDMNKLFKEFFESYIKETTKNFADIKELSLMGEPYNIKCENSIYQQPIYTRDHRSCARLLKSHQIVENYLLSDTNRELNK